MTTTTRPSLTHERRTLGWIGLAGVALGIGAGVTQLIIGSAIPQWTGNKIDTTGLGVTTIILSLVAGVGLAHLPRALPRWERIGLLLLVLACVAVCFTTVGQLWYVPGPLLITAAVMAFIAGPSETVDSSPVDRPVGRSTVGIAGWLLYGLAVTLGVALAVSPLFTFLLKTRAPSVAAAAAVTIVAGLSMTAYVAPALRHQALAMTAIGLGAGLMAGGLVLGVSAVMIAMM